MKIAVTAEGTDLGARVDPRLGRAQYFVVFDADSQAVEVLDNSPALDRPEGAGILAAQRVAQHGVKVVLTGHCGPKAYRTLTAAGVRVAVGVSGTVGEAIQRYLSGALNPTTGPDVGGHW